VLVPALTEIDCEAGSVPPVTQVNESEAGAGVSGV
jgi:hypothetical protein